jgi:hypothetical protein
MQRTSAIKVKTIFLVIIIFSPFSKRINPLSNFKNDAHQAKPFSPLGDIAPLGATYWQFQVIPFHIVPSKVPPAFYQIPPFPPLLKGGKGGLRIFTGCA